MPPSGKLAQCRRDEMEKYLLHENERDHPLRKKKKFTALQTHFLASHHFLEFSHLLKLITYRFIHEENKLNCLAMLEKSFLGSGKFITICVGKAIK